MAPRNRRHIRVAEPATTEAFKPPPRRIEAVLIAAPGDRAGYVARLTTELVTTVESGQVRRQEQGVAVPGAVNGVYVEFDSLPGVDFELQRLDSVAANGPRLIAVSDRVGEDQTTQRAVVWIPEGGQAAFLRKFAQYAETVGEAKPRNRDLVDRIDRIRLATLRSLWTDHPDDFPDDNNAVWWELWLRRRDGHELERLEAFAAAAAVNVGPGRLSFTDRLVVLCRATAQSLARGLDSLDDLAELRKPRPLIELVSALPSAMQMDVVNALVQRTDIADHGAPAVSLLDTGVFQEHPLLTASLSAADCHRCSPNWRLDDELGHGTRMAGLSLYGDLAGALANPQPVHLSHRLESVRVYPPHGQINPPDLHGQLTGSAVSRVEAQEPGRKRVFAMAISTRASDNPTPDPGMPWVGQPTSWSAAIDALAAGLGVVGAGNDLVFLRDEQAPQRLFLLAMGNVGTYGADHLNRSDIELAHDPAQSWNAVSVGAYTTLTSITDEAYAGWNVLAAEGELSPHSCTSVGFNRVWPAKPDIVLEGGNVAISPAGVDIDEGLDELSTLTTRTMAIDPRPLTTMNMTSAATAQAAFIAASVMADYPNLWPETVRALMVHSAEWTERMQEHFEGATRSEKNAMRRRYGMGVPSLSRATRSATDAATLIVEDVIRPFDGGKMRELHIHNLPWPQAVLEDLGETPVSLRLTLSYFIEPNPGSRGWKRRYAYPSHGLRFALKRATETVQQFRQRVNLRAREEDEGWAPGQGAAESGEWMFGTDLRTVGSLHTDIWKGTAADLAARGVIAVYPVSGWWKERPELDHSALGSRYALVVTITTPEEAADVWTPIAQEVHVPIEIIAEN